MEVSAAAQTAAITGIGMLYCGTAHRLMAEFLLGEIACCSRGDRMRDREAYTLSAGLALGLVTLGKGCNEAAGLGDLEIAACIMPLLVALRANQQIFARVAQ